CCSRQRGARCRSLKPFDGSGCFALMALSSFSEFAEGLRALDQSLIAPDRFAAAFCMQTGELAALVNGCPNPRDFGDEVRIGLGRWSCER
ncbi:MAG: hypothetical protein ACREXP_06540, partial [Steroidobacteraceae bacterium]